MTENKMTFRITANGLVARITANGLVAFEMQATDYPRTRPDLPIYEHELFKAFAEDKTFTKEDRELLEDWALEVLISMTIILSVFARSRWEERDAAFSKCRADLVIARRLVQELAQELEEKNEMTLSPR